ncbi:ABC transporter substrate-binding protein [Ramlibacter sp. G-1-2-2]|uniref:ABC transporter substrate-binding protein n=1 Tax=Ramlibacter agri TaxID=2728837 RepID=A0A848HCQ9_9BURK|nr:ABC transporter substrate-binding protein [Ramlibacter agri]NML47269.1 ABC transporter substrate-binding protein [Ramlibacter agri]
MIRVLTRRTLLAQGGRAAVAGAATLAGLQARAAGEMKLGWIQPMTGPLASSFSPNYLGADIAFEEINAAGGILGTKLVKVLVDDEAAPGKEPIVTRRLVDEGCRFILGPTGSSQTLASLEVSTPAKVISASYATASEVGDGKRYPYHYQFNFTADAVVQRIAEYYAKRGYKRIGLLLEDSAAGASVRTAAMRELAKRGMQVVSDQTFPIKTADMTPFLRKLRNDGAEALQVHVANNADITQMLVGLSRIGWKPPLAGHAGLLFAGTPGAVPDSARYPEVFTATFQALTYTDDDLPTARVRNFVKRIAAGKLTETQLGPAATTPFYDFLYALKYAVEQAKSWDPDHVKQVLDTSSAIPGLFGPMKFSPANHTAYDVSVVGMAVSNSTQEPLSQETRGLLRRRAPNA